MSTQLGSGTPYPLGATLVSQGLNMAVWAPDASAIDVCLFDVEGQVELARLRLPRFTDGVWHGLLAGDPAELEGLIYAFRVHGPWKPAEGLRFNPRKLMLDPWAQEVVGRYGSPGQPTAVLAQDLAHYADADPQHPERPDRHDNARIAVKGRVVAPLPAGLARPTLQPAVPWPRTVIYEVHVKGATQRHPGVPEAQRGRYAGLAHPAMLAHYARLGITSLCLLPVHARADEARLQQLGLTNYWGYSTLSWFAPEPRYASRPEAARAEFAAMVQLLHGAGLEVLLDVVYNHSGEVDVRGPSLSLRGLANRGYYRLEGTPARYVDMTGCGNTLDLSHPRVVELVIGSLRHWVTHYGVDGFRFDLASVLGRGENGSFSRHSAFFAALRADPVLARVKLIAEPWDLGPGGYQVGGFPPGWAEWNDQYRDTLRKWWLGSVRAEGSRPQPADRGMFAHRFAGSSEQFHHSGRAPTAGINFVTAHDGYNLRDLVSYQERHNQANGEDNRDGHHANCSWHCGVEGPTRDPEVLRRRARLQRALLATLLLAQGTPMLLAGDELGHSQGGNNNAYCQDNPTTWLDWEQADHGLIAATARLLALRRDHAALRAERWLSGRPDLRGWRDVVWLHPEGRELHGADWSEPMNRGIVIRLVAPVLDEETARHAAEAGERRDQALLILVNPLAGPCNFVIPAAPWEVLFCTWQADGAPQPAEARMRGGIWPIAAHGLAVLRTPLAALPGPDTPPAAHQAGATDDRPGADYRSSALAPLTDLAPLPPGGDPR